MIYTLNTEERALFDLIGEAASNLKVEAYVVGGFVRDKMLGRTCKDIDVVCLGDGIVLAHEVAAMLQPRPWVSVFERFGTAMIRHGEIEIEFVGARKESYSKDSRKPAVESGTLEDDQNRRDFTINAMAVSLNASNFGDILDPFGGIGHLSQKLIKTPLDPGRTFSDDPLRMMRAIRFATQLGFRIEADSFAGIRQYKDRIRIISQERITTELEKILASEKPSVGFKLLDESELLPLILPEVAELKGVEERNGIAHKDNFYHTLQVVDNICAYTDNIWLRWAALFHDIAKPPTKRFNPEIGWTFYGHEALGAAMIPRLFKKLRLPLDSKMKFVQKMVRLHLRPISLTKEEITDSAVRRLLFDAGDDIDELMTLCRADITSKNEYKVDRYLNNYSKLEEKIKDVEEKDHLRNWQPPISGEEIMRTFGLSPCREVGDIKNAIREAILEGEIPNEYDAAFQFMLKEGEKRGLVTA